MVAYVNLIEKVQEWSEASSPPRRWTRRVTHFALMMFAIFLVSYGYLTYAGVVISLLRDFSVNPAALVSLFIVSNGIVIWPFIMFRRHIFRPVKVKKLWEQ
jgi:hypothetical protein